MGPAEGARVDHDRGGFGRHKTYPSGTMAGAVTGIPEGRATETIYGLIRDGKHDECAKLLEIQLANAPDSRPALSLLGYCYYYLDYFYLSRSGNSSRCLFASLMCRPPIDYRHSSSHWLQVPSLGRTTQ